MITNVQKLDSLIRRGIIDLRQNDANENFFHHYHGEEGLNVLLIDANYISGSGTINVPCGPTCLHLSGFVQVVSASR
jgi:hypothetical protein